MEKEEGSIREVEGLEDKPQAKVVDGEEGATKPASSSVGEEKTEVGEKDAGKTELVGLPIKHLRPRILPPKVAPPFYNWRDIFPFLQPLLDNRDVIKREMMNVRYGLALLHSQCIHSHSAQQVARLARVRSL